MRKTKKEPYEVTIFKDRILDYLRYNLEKRLKRLEFIEKIVGLLSIIAFSLLIGSLIYLTNDITIGFLSLVVSAIATYLSFNIWDSVSKEIEIIKYTLSYGRYIAFDPVELKEELRSWRRERFDKDD